MKLTKLETLIVILTVVVGVGTFAVTRALAEQSAGTPNSLVNSVIKDAYDNLVTLGYGSETGSNGAIWNRLISASTWVPDGTATVADVVVGKTYFDESRTAKTGTLDFPKYKDQSLQAKDYRDANGSTTWSSWSLTSGAATTGVYKDGRTGLYWSATQGATATNNFNLLSCDFFSTVPRGNYTGADVDCDVSINRCATLELDANGDSTLETKWYLPTQAELMTAYLNGIYLATNTTWVTGNIFWSSTEDQGTPTYAWRVNLPNGYASTGAKSTTLYVRCVLRDLN